MMTMPKRNMVGLLASPALALSLAGPVSAQDVAAGQTTTIANIDEAGDAITGAPTLDNAPDDPDSDNVADDLNARQQLRQSFTLERSIDGELVQSETRTLTYSRGTPQRATEAGLAPHQDLLRKFDGEVLTRTEALEEARLDFTLGDKDRSGALSVDEYTALLASWDEKPERQAPAATKAIARQRQYDAFLADISGDKTALASTKAAHEKFARLTSETSNLSRAHYISEYLSEFDAMDADENSLLRGDELIRFRAINRGEALK